MELSTYTIKTRKSGTTQHNNHILLNGFTRGIGTTFKGIIKMEQSEQYSNENVIRSAIPRTMRPIAKIVQNANKTTKHYSTITSKWAFILNTKTR